MAMGKTSRAFIVTLAAVWLSTAMTGPAMAYIGPGAGISAIGTFLAAVGAVVLLIVGFLWYPVKRMLRKNKKVPAAQNTADTTAASQKKQ